jgi:hypothetical protein
LSCQIACSHKSKSVYSTGLDDIGPPLKRGLDFVAVGIEATREQCLELRLAADQMARARSSLPFSSRTPNGNGAPTLT